MAEPHCCCGTVLPRGPCMVLPRPAGRCRHAGASREHLHHGHRKHPRPVLFFLSHLLVFLSHRRFAGSPGPSCKSALAAQVAAASSRPARSTCPGGEGDRLTSRRCCASHQHGPGRSTYLPTHSAPRSATDLMHSKQNLGDHWPHFSPSGWLCYTHTFS